ncbi:hypothetical protein PLICRDRAFT_276408 [Plicaturopsis crispa FD-325 SS-3]|nr:hypothetical protein PLICRDRAFT_276408 [Plicaturopsis crispa FD-325 SS-3]
MPRSLRHGVLRCDSLVKPSPPPSRYYFGVQQPDFYFPSMERPRKRVHDVQGGEDTDHDGSEGKRPRPSSSRKRKKRATFSCSECKRRKIKCDRQLPCDQCIAREEIDLCEFKSPPAPHDAPKDPPTFDPRQSELLQSLASRVAHLEHLLSVSTPTHLPPTPPSHPASHTSPSLSVARSGLDSDTEDAVLALENLAKGNGVSVNYGKLGHRPLTSEAEPVDHAQGPPDEQKVPSYDWTETSTSIFIREPFNTSDVVASDFLARSLASLKGSDEQILDRIYAVLPPPSIAKTLIDLRFDRINWLWNVQHRPTFLNECEQFWGLRSEDRARVDPAWLALYAQTLALGANADADSLPDECVAYLPLASGQAHILWFETSKLALELAKWAVKPQFRVIQTIILFGPLISPIGSAYAIRRCFSIGPNGAHFGIWLAAAIRLAQMMGLHKLGNDTAIMPPNDLAFPPRPSGLRREMGVRLWNFLLLLDWKASKSRDFIISPLSFTTTIPANCDDEDLTLDDVVVHPKPAHRMTDMVHMIYARALFGHCSDIASILRSPQGVSYDNILDFDAQFRKQANPLLGEGLLLPENRDVQREQYAYLRHISLLNILRQTLWKSGHIYERLCTIGFSVCIDPS